MAGLAMAGLGAQLEPVMDGPKGQAGGGRDLIIADLLRTRV